MTNKEFLKLIQDNFYQLAGTYTEGGAISPSIAYESKTRTSQVKGCEIVVRPLYRAPRRILGSYLGCVNRVIHLYQHLGNHNISEIEQKLYEFSINIGGFDFRSKQSDQDFQQSILSASIVSFWMVDEECCVEECIN